MSTGVIKRVPRVGQWLPEDHTLMCLWLQRLLDQIDKKRSLYDGADPFVPVIQ